MTDFFDWINEIKEPELKRLISKSFERWDENDDPFAGYNYLSVTRNDQGQIVIRQRYINVPDDENSKPF